MRATPNWARLAIGAAAKMQKTTAITVAAPVMTLAVRSSPKAMAASLSPSRSQCSRIRISRKTA